MLIIWYEKCRDLSVAIYGLVKLAWDAYRLGFICIALIAFMQGLIPVVTALLTKTLFDSLALELQSDVQPSLPIIIPITLGCLMFLTIANQLGIAANTYLNAELGRRLSLSTQLKIYEKINSLVGLEPFENPKFYDKIQLAVQGAQRGPSQVINILITVIPSLITAFSFLGVLIAFSPFLAAMVTFVVLPQLYIQLRIGRQRLGLALGNSSRERRAAYFGHILSGVQFAKELRFFNVTNHFLSSFRSVSKEIRYNQRQQQIHEIRSQLPATLAASLVSSAVFAFIVLQAFEGRLGLGDVMLYINAVTGIQGALLSLILALSSLNEGILFYSRFIELQHLRQPLELIDSARSVPELRFSIELRNVSFRYNERQPWILRNLNLVIPHGKCLALVGRNGAGKSTLVKLLMRLYDPTEGQILWDGIDIRDFSPEELRSHMCAIFQDFNHYDISARENIAVGNISAVNEDVIHRAAEQAGVHNLIKRLPNGYDTILSQWLADDNCGVELSGGEWQKIAMARLLMRTGDLLLLDEPTAALDPQAEYELHAHFAERSRNSTCVIITHRFNTVRIADIVAVIEDGHIEEYGSHAELLKRKGTYANMYALQESNFR